MLLSYHDDYRLEADASEPVTDRPVVNLRKPDAYDELTDEQVAEAYATNVAGNATSRKGQLKALRALDAEASATE